ncbi:unnamed protein product [Protopolystoma xenopodis]|uniref:Uncharacterized protein n=1 Tax=Protopolystoma xenopodis TaxID=117903 RepID=A0A448XRA8_9PLAT|nr:unnamed protein product [Protopolystoma xenopodis]
MELVVGQPTPSILLLLVSTVLTRKSEAASKSQSSRVEMSAGLGQQDQVELYGIMEFTNWIGATMHTIGPSRH